MKLANFNRFVKPGSSIFFIQFDLYYLKKYKEKDMHLKGSSYGFFALPNLGFVIIFVKAIFLIINIVHKIKVRGCL